MARSNELRDRTKRLALRVMRLSGSLPNTPAGRTVAHQIIRSGTSIGANYRAAQQARSKAEFIAKLGVAEEEADETCYWLELIIEGGLAEEHKVVDLLQEANEVTKILAASRKTAKQK